MTTSLTPAYGRSYITVASCRKAWFEGADFVLHPQGCYVNINDMLNRAVGDFYPLKLYYSKHDTTKFTIINRSDTE